MELAVRLRWCTATSRRSSPCRRCEFPPLENVCRIRTLLLSLSSRKLTLKTYHSTTVSNFCPESISTAIPCAVKIWMDRQSTAATRSGMSDDVGTHTTHTHSHTQGTHTHTHPPHTRTVHAHTVHTLITRTYTHIHTHERERARTRARA